MSYSAAVRDIWRHVDLGDAAKDHRHLVRYATLAASSHNTQPWKFDLERNGVSILADSTRRCPEVDPDDHHLYASLGCAVENLLLAAQAAGLRGHCAVERSSGDIEITFERAPAHRSALFEAIPRRQCSRSKYDGSELSADERSRLEQVARGDGVSVLWLSSQRQKEQVTELVAAGNVAQFSDAAWREEMLRWIRFTAREALRTGDGLYGPVMGKPQVPRSVAKLLMPFVMTASGQNAKDAAHIRSSGAIAVVCSDGNDKPHWIEAGRCYQRLALQATALGLRTAFINQPVEVLAIRLQFAAFLGIGERRPDLIVRIGRGPEMPRSLRRPLEHVLIGALRC